MSRQTKIDFQYYERDLPSAVPVTNMLAVDTETMGLHPHRDRLCLVQLSWGDGKAILVRIPKEYTGMTVEERKAQSPNLCAILTNPDVIKLFHFARFDVGILTHTFGLDISPVCCTKIASKLVRTFTERHGLKELCREFAGVEISKQEQSSDWGAETLTSDQLRYAASDVLYLHQIWQRLEVMLVREGRLALAQACFDFISTRARLDLLGMESIDVLSY